MRNLGPLGQVNLCSRTQVFPVTPFLRLLQVARNSTREGLRQGKSREEGSP